MDSLSSDTQSRLLEAYEKQDRGQVGFVTMTDKEYEKISLVKDRSAWTRYGTLGVFGSSAAYCIIMAGLNANDPRAMMSLAVGLTVAAFAIGNFN